jgi:hypothetical protein
LSLASYTSGHLQDGKFVRSKTTIAAMRNVLLTESLGFTKNTHVRVPASRCRTHNSTPEDGDAFEDASAQLAHIFGLHSLSEAHKGDGMNVTDNVGHFGFSVSTFNPDISILT